MRKLHVIEFCDEGISTKMNKQMQEGMYKMENGIYKVFNSIYNI